MHEVSSQPRITGLPPNNCDANQLATQENRQVQKKTSNSRKDRAVAKHLREKMETLSDDERQSIIDHVYANENPIVTNSFNNRPKIREMYLLNELERRL